MFRGNFDKYRLVYAHLWATYGKNGLYRLSFVLQIIKNILKLIVLPVAISQIISNLSVHDYEGAKNAVIMFVAGSSSLGIVSPFIKYIGMVGENKVYAAATAQYFSKLVCADIDYFNSNLSGYLTTATRQYVDSGVQFVRAIRDRYSQTMMTLAFPIGVITWVNYKIGAIVIVLSAIQAVYMLWASGRVNKYRTFTREIFKHNSGVMSDYISNILTVKATGQETTSVQKVSEGAEAEAAAYKQRYTVQSELNGGREVITVSIFMIILWLVVETVRVGQLNLAGAILVVTYINTILNGIYAFADELDEHDDFVDKIIPAFDILNRQNKVVDPKKPIRMMGVKGAISFEGISFAYAENSGEDIFNDFTLQIPHGQKVGVVGLSGAGKSTLTKLLLRFSDVRKGKVMIDGIDVRDVRQADLRSNIAYVPQEPLLFHSSIRENITISRPDACEVDIERAVRAAHASSFVEKLPDKLDSVVGERGVKLSGGQKQRIAIARAVLQRTPIIILDEATSALDSESEQIIKSSFKDILRGKTAIVVAHRLSTLSDMDRIIVIENGKVVEDGSHKTLLARDGIYAKLWRRQQRHEDEVVSIS